MNKKDLLSFEVHDRDYQTVFNLENSLKRIAEYDEVDLYAQNGFEEAVNLAIPSVDIHVDIGCGSGWLIRKTAPKFKKAIGIDPSSHAIEIAKEVNKDFANVQFLVGDMVDALEKIRFQKPILITTAVVLSHIKDYYVKHFLMALNGLPEGSILFFHEPYDSNIQQKLWYVRNKKWWSDNLEQWDLEFKDLPGPYKYGIYGTKVGKDKRKRFYKNSFNEELSWQMNGLENKFNRLARFVKRSIK